MLYFFRNLLSTIIINIDQETVLNWFGVENPNNQSIFYQEGKTGYDLSSLTVETEPSSALSLETLRLIIEGLWERIQDGLTLTDIENALFIILFIRFIILAIRYNLKTSFRITCIGLFAGYLWYRHLIDLILMYRNILLKLPFLHKLGMDAIDLRFFNNQMISLDLKLGDNVHWYNPGQLIYYSFTKGIVNIDSETGSRHYIDPISMIISNLKEPTRSSIIPIYYKIYNKIIPAIFGVFSTLASQISGIVAYTVITRIGKRYCPYLIRWHWTFLLIISLVEQSFIYFVYRVSYFQTFVLVPQVNNYTIYNTGNITFQINFLNGVIACVVLTHIGIILFGMFHAVCGQYFYFPFFVENTELHIGPRDKTSIYSGGKTAWQDEKEKNVNRVFPKLWYGWFGRGAKANNAILNSFKISLRKILKKFLK